METRPDLDGTDIPDEYIEPCDSCESCGVNIYEHQEDGDRLCDQCAFYRDASKPKSAKESP